MILLYMHQLIRQASTGTNSASSQSSLEGEYDADTEKVP